MEFKDDEGGEGWWRGLLSTAAEAQHLEVSFVDCLTAADTGFAIQKVRIYLKLC